MKKETEHFLMAVAVGVIIGLEIALIVLLALRLPS